MNNNQMLRTACRLGNLDVAKWVTETYHLDKRDARVMDDYALCYACENGHADVVEWLIDRFELQPEDRRRLCVPGATGITCWPTG